MNEIKDRVLNLNFKSWLGENWKVVIFLSLLVGIAYANSLHSDFVSDDTRAILTNNEISRFDSVFKNKTEFLRPLFYFVINKIFAAQPIYYRLINIFFHLGVVVILYSLLCILSSRAIAVIAASILAVHPVAIEAVGWISGGAYSQYSFFVILSLFLYILSYKNNKLFFLSVFSFVLGLLSSGLSIFFPLVIMIFIVSFDSLRRNWRRLAIFFAISGVWAIIYAFKITERIHELSVSFYQKPQMLNPFMQIPIAITSYLELIFWPSNLTLYHSEMRFGWSEYLLRLFIFVLFVSIVIYSYRRSKFVFFWLSFFIANLLLTLTPFGISWIVAERYVYLGSIGIFAVVALSLSRLDDIKNFKILSRIFFILIIIMLTARTVTRNIDWQNEDNLWMATIKTSPSSPNAHNNLGDVYSRQEDFEKAASEFSKAIQLKPDYADAYHNLALTYHKMGRLHDAVVNYNSAIKFNPNLWQSYQNLAAIYFMGKKFDLAKTNLIKAIEISPKSSNLYSSLGVVYLATGEEVLAKNKFEESLSLNPDDPIAKQVMGY
jgi:Tfp pilus assembly protein PilF